MRIAMTSDLHGYLPEIPDCDLLLIGGDICPFCWSDRELWWEEQLLFLNGTFRRWLDAIVRRKIEVVAIAGNHDVIFSEQPSMVPQLPWTYLQDSGTEKGTPKLNVKIWGTPWSLPYGDWPFMVDEIGLEDRFSIIPADTDIIVVHGPPFGFGDAVVPRITAENESLWPEPRHAGSVALLERIYAIKPRLVVYGHIHEGHGRYMIGKTVAMNVALVDRSLLPKNTVRLMELP
jgi:Icc-related predicted phosphoesterase